MSSDSAWPSFEHRFHVDVGGTFTDCLHVRPDGTTAPSKVLSSGVLKTEPAGFADDFFSDWTRHDDGSLSTGEPAPVVAIRLALRVRRSELIPPVDLRLGTTRGTNALLTRTGARTAFLTTAGFGDALRIGAQERPELFALRVVKPEPLAAGVVEVTERIAADGSVLTPLNEAKLRDDLARIRSDGAEAVAIAFVNACHNQEHECAAGRLAREAGFAVVSVSTELSPSIKFVPRADTTVLDAYLRPVLDDYLVEIGRRLPDSRVRLMTSDGSLVAPAAFGGPESVLSGPAGGVVGMADAARAAGFSQAIGFDMGGTSTDVSRWAGSLEVTYESTKAGVRLATPTLAIETVAAGGGSVCDWDGARLRVGPDSAGADPGPACYGRGGPLTVTDCNLVLGRLRKDAFPFPLDEQAARTHLERIRADAGFDSAELLAAGFVRVADLAMARAVRRVSVEKGADPKDHALVCFGGAGGQHACAVAEELGCRTVIVPALASVLSAHGIGLATVRRRVERPVLRSLSEFLTVTARKDTPREDALEVFASVAETRTNADRTIPRRRTTEADASGSLLFAELRREATEAVRVAGGEATTFEESLDLRYFGTDAALTIARPGNDDWSAVFEAEHQRRFGSVRNAEIEVVAARVAAESSGHADSPGLATTPPRASSDTEDTLPLWTGEHFERVPSVPRGRLGGPVAGPAVLFDEHSTTVVRRGWSATVGEHSSLILARNVRVPDGADELRAVAARRSDDQRRETAIDPVRLEVFQHRFAGIAEQMGATLRATSVSVNVKERLDFSCAVFDPAGRLVVNAPHIPVHLGAMGRTVRDVLARFDLHPGDAVVTNDPFAGGSHLPDVTVVQPVFDGGRLRMVVASRAHHAEIGGVTPGSVPPFSESLAEEGVLISGVVVRDGQNVVDVVGPLLEAGPSPSRNVRDNIADLRAQVAAGRLGVELLMGLGTDVGWNDIAAATDALRTAARVRTEKALSERLSDGGERSAVDRMDDGSEIRVSIGGPTTTPVRIDFTGTAGQLPSNLNAPAGITDAAAMYVLRLLAGDGLLLNEGVLEAVELVVPEGCLLNPRPEGASGHTPAVVGGNTETSQRVVDVLLSALSLAAGSQGTMNNFTFGDGSFGYYETIAGGSGATPSGPGADAVQVHMTNTRMTDVEVMEHRLPVRVRRFAVRRGSGGAGRHRGGDGVIRELEFLQPLSVSLVTGRRETRPPGLNGGEPGASGRNVLIVGGKERVLGWRDRVDVRPGDRLRVETPGGGGVG